MKLKRQNKIIDEVVKVQRAFEEAWVELIAKRAPKPSCLQCTKPSCCDQRTVAWFFEVLPLARYLKDNKLATPEFMKELYEVGEGMEAVDPAVWFDKRKPCVFLKNNRCSVYEYKPLTSCTSYWVISPAELCDAENDTVVKQIDPRKSWDYAIDISQRVHTDLGLTQHTDRLLIAAFPRVLWIALAAWNKPDWVDFVHDQDWPNSNQLIPWLQGESPRKLVQLRRMF